MQHTTYQLKTQRGLADSVEGSRPAHLLKHSGDMSSDAPLPVRDSKVRVLSSAQVQLG